MPNRRIKSGVYKSIIFYGVDWNCIKVTHNGPPGENYSEFKAGKGDGSWSWLSDTSIVLIFVEIFALVAK